MRTRINYRRLQESYADARHKHGRREGSRVIKRFIRESLEADEFKASDFSIRQLAEALVLTKEGEPCGREWVESLNPANGDGMELAEAVNAVDTSAFSNITQELISDMVMEGYEQAGLVMSNLVRTVPTTKDGERIPGMGQLLESDIEKIDEAHPYPMAGFGEDYIETPTTDKRGLIVPVTKEAIFFDRTNLVAVRAREVGEVLGVNKEKRLSDLLIGQTNNYRWRGTTYGTYSTDGTSTAHYSGTTVLAGVINKLAGNELVDWTDVDAAEQLFAEILSPTTGEPVVLSAKSVVVMPAYSHAAKRVFNATEIRYNNVTGTAANAYDAPTTTILSNPITGYTWYASPWAYRRLIAASVSAGDAKKYWFVGDFQKAFWYMENWPITVTQAPANSEAEFVQDIVLRFKASERGVGMVADPRYVVMCTG
mgnify:CR=1 FL=1